MSDFSSSVPFDLTGEFGGVVLTDAGKRRLRLLVGGEERLLKVPRDLRRRMSGNFRVGQTIRVSGSEERDLSAGTGKWVVTAVLPLDGGRGRAELPAESERAAAAPEAVREGSIRVCAKKNCWRNGGRELCAALERGVELRGLEGKVRVKAVNCLDRCKQGPNVDWGEREFSRCRLQDAAAILDLVSPAKAPAEANV